MPAGDTHEHQTASPDAARLDWYHDVVEAARLDWTVWDGRHDAVRRQRRLFQFDHLPEHLQAISRPYAGLAAALLRVLPDSPELTNALHRLWESKNLAVVAAIGPEGS